MKEIDFSKVSDSTLLLACEGAQFLGVSRRYFYQMENRKFFSRATGAGQNPRYLLKDLKVFKAKAMATGYLPLRNTKIDISDESVSDDVYATREEVMEFFRIASTTLTERVAKGVIPQPVRLWEGAHPRWRVGDIRKCLKQE